MLLLFDKLLIVIKYMNLLCLLFFFFLKFKKKLYMYYRDRIFVWLIYFIRYYDYF